ncbi:MAG TPA: hypothetical protein VK842_07150 [bacterium]|jgi:hypothetical protein|nr:hypothetical protein [bacterium]
MNARISDLPRPLLLGLLGAALLGAVASLELATDAVAAARPFPPPLERPLPAGLTRMALSAALGGESRVAADVSYINCLQYVGGAWQDGFYGRTMEHYAEVAWLDPSFKHAVVEGISVLGWMLRRPDDAMALGRRAMAADPKEARYGAYMAALAYQKHLDPDKVIEALRPELARPDAPDMLLRLVGNLYLQKRDWKTAQAYWNWAADRMKTPEDRDFALKSLDAAQKHQVSITNRGTHAL